MPRQKANVLAAARVRDAYGFASAPKSPSDESAPASAVTIAAPIAADGR